MVAIVNYYEVRFEYDNGCDCDTGIMYDTDNKPLRGNDLDELRVRTIPALEKHHILSPSEYYSFQIVKITVSEIGGKFSYEETVVEEM